MKRKCGEILYNERSKIETIFSVAKRRFNSKIKSYDNTMKIKELLIAYWLTIVTKYVYHSCLILWIISRKH